MAVLSEKECAYVHYSSNLAHCVLPLSLYNPGLEFFIQNSTSPRLSVTMSIACFKTLPKISPIRCVHSLQAFMLTPADPRHNHRAQQGDFRHDTSPTRSHSVPAKPLLGYIWLIYPVSLHGRHYLILYRHLWSNLATKKEPWASDFCLPFPTAFQRPVGGDVWNWRYAHIYRLQIHLTWTLEQPSLHSPPLHD